MNLCYVHPTVLSNVQSMICTYLYRHFAIYSLITAAYCPHKNLTTTNMRNRNMEWTSGAFFGVKLNDVETEVAFHLPGSNRQIYPTTLLLGK